MDCKLRLIVAHIMDKNRSNVLNHAYLVRCWQEEEAAVGENTKPGDVRRVIQHDHQINPLRWFEDKVKLGMPVPYICFQLAI